MSERSLVGSIRDQFFDKKCDLRIFDKIIDKDNMANKSNLFKKLYLFNLINFKGKKNNFIQKFNNLDQKTTKNRLIAPQKV